EAMADGRRDHATKVVEQATKKTARTRPFRDSSNDTSLVTELFATEQGEDLTGAALNLLPHVEGAFSFVYMDENAPSTCGSRFSAAPVRSSPSSVAKSS